MRISRTRSFRTNMGNFESYEFGATVTLDWDDLQLPADGMPFEEQYRTLSDTVVMILDEQLVQEIQDAAELTDEEKSFVLELVAPPKPTKNRRPRRA